MIQEFLDYEQKNKGLSENTLRAYGDDLRAFARWASSTGTACRWSQVRKGDIDAFIANRHDLGDKAATLRRRVSSIRAFYDYLRKQGKMEHNPARYCEMPKRERQLPNTIDIQAITTYIEDITKPLALRTIIAILYETGIRISELTGLEVRDVDFMRKTLRVYGKGLKGRIVYFDYYTSRLLSLYLSSKQQRDGIIFTGADGCQREIRYQIWRALTNSATNGKASPHTIRHTYATRMLEQGMPIQSLQRLMGHEQITTTEGYLRLTNGTIEKDYRQAVGA